MNPLLLIYLKVRFYYPTEDHWSKLQTGRYFLERIVPDAEAHLAKLKTGSEVLMAMPAEAF